MLARLILAFITLVCAASAAPAARPNVLFVAIDDLRPDLGAYGVAHARTPSLDRFASSARIFTNHYVHVPTCGASRAALLRGRYPSDRVHLSNNAILSTHAQWGDANLPAWLQRHGYRTLSLGKITHYPGGRSGKAWMEGPVELPGAWERAWIPETPWKTAEGMMHGYANGGARKSGQTPPFEATEGPDSTYPDAWVADEAVTTLRSLAKSDRPWFFAVGLFKPHLPFAAPKRYFDLHDPAKIPAPPAYPAAENALGFHKSGEFRGNYGHGGRDPAKDPAYAAEIRRAYAASTSYVDAQFGRVLAALDELGLAQNTLLVFTSDHGYNEGRHYVKTKGNGQWIVGGVTGPTRPNMWDTSVMIPLLMRWPGQIEPGRKIDAMLSNVDFFRTFLGAVGVPVPPDAKAHGMDFSPVLRGAMMKISAPAVYGQYDLHNGALAYMRMIRTDRYKLVRFFHARNQDELYDLQADPDENKNLLSGNNKRPEAAAIEKDLRAQLEAWMKSINDPLLRDPY